HLRWRQWRPPTAQPSRTSREESTSEIGSWPLLVWAHRHRFLLGIECEGGRGPTGGQTGGGFPLDDLFATREDHDPLVAGSTDAIGNPLRGGVVVVDNDKERRR